MTKFLHRRRVRAMLLALCALTAPEPAAAKPLSYVGGTMLMVENDETGNAVSLDYTMTPRLAGALFVKRETGPDAFTEAGPQVNALLKRWNAEHAQGNIFLMSGAGVALREGRDRFAAWTSILADYETRRIFTSYEIRFMYAQGIEKSVWQRARAGFAPYLGNYEDLNTWLMVQVDHHTAKKRTTVVTPLVRIFYKTTLVEAGVSTRGTGMLNLVQQF